MADASVRFVALDVHKAYVVIGAVDETPTVVLPPRRVSLAAFSEWVGRHLLPTDQMVLETTINAWTFYDQLVPLISRVVVANPAQVKLIAASFVKTDKRDTLALARLLAANLIPTVWVPPPAVRELRALVAHRQRLLKQRTMAKHRRHEFAPPAQPDSTSLRTLCSAPPELVGSPGAAPPARGALACPARPCVSRLPDDLDSHPGGRTGPREPGEDMEGAGPISDSPARHRLDRGDDGAGSRRRYYPLCLERTHLVGYAGLGTRVHASGQVHRSGGITRAGRSELRTILVEAAWTTLRVSAWWRTRYEQLTTRMPPNKAIVAIAPKLLVVIWHVLSEQVADQQADPVAVARRLFRWGAGHHVAIQSGLSRGTFVRRYLDQLGIGQTLTHLAINGYTFALNAPG